MNSFSSWPHLWFGCWKEYGPEYARSPSVEKFIDNNWNYPYKKEVASYLRLGHSIATTSRLGLPNVFGECDEYDSISWKTDGKWLWLEDLSIYILRNSLRPPDEMIKHIECNHFEIPENIDLESLQLDWPTV